MKQCCICKKQRHAFNRNRSKHDGLSSICRACSKKHSRNYYKANKERMRVQIRSASDLRIQKNTERVVAYLLDHPCVDCGENNPIVLDLDHVRGSKIADVSKLLGGGYSWSNVEIEIQKCVVRCANCHRKKSAKQRGDLRVRILERVLGKKYAPVVELADTPHSKRGAKA